MPITTPMTRRLLIHLRNQGAGGVAALRARQGRERLLPSFLIVGAQKAGTTFLYCEMVRHPQVLPALTKEVQFFSEHYDRGLPWYAGFFPTVRTGPDGSSMTACDATPEYLFHPLGPQRIAQSLPDAKIIVVLRDPVKRAYSHYQHERRLGYEPAATFEEALDLEAARTRGERERMVADPGFVSYPLWHYAYRERGHYAEQLTHLYQHVPADRVLVLLAEELYGDPLGTVERVVDFVGLTPWRPLRPGPNDMASPGGPMSEHARETLTQHFRPHNRELAALLGRELPWASAT